MFSLCLQPIINKTRINQSSPETHNNLVLVCFAYHRCLFLYWFSLSQWASFATRLYVKAYSHGRVQDTPKLWEFKHRKLETLVINLMPEIALQSKSLFFFTPGLVCSCVSCCVLEVYALKKWSRLYKTRKVRVAREVLVIYNAVACDRLNISINIYLISKPWINFFFIRYSMTTLVHGAFLLRN